MTETEDSHILETVIGERGEGLYQRVVCTGHEGECGVQQSWMDDCAASAEAVMQAAERVLHRGQIHVTGVNEYGVEAWEYLDGPTGDHKKLIAEVRELTECECDREGMPMQECGTHGDHVALLIRVLADALEAVTAGVVTETSEHYCNPMCKTGCEHSGEIYQRQVTPWTPAIPRQDGGEA